MLGKSYSGPKRQFRGVLEISDFPQLLRCRFIRNCLVGDNRVVNEMRHEVVTFLTNFIIGGGEAKYEFYWQMSITMHRRFFLPPNTTPRVHPK